MIEVVASTVVSFGSGSGSDALVVFELDEEMNDEETSFAPGDDIFLRLHHDSSVSLDKMLATNGQIDNQGTGTRTIETQLLWQTVDDSHDLSYIPSGGLTAEYYGNEATGLKKSGDRQAVITGGTMPALSLISYSATFSLFRLIAPSMELESDESYPIMVVAYMEETT